MAVSVKSVRETWPDAAGGQWQITRENMHNLRKPATVG